MWKASILLAVLTCLHFTTATFFPGLFAAALIASRSRGFARPIIDLALYPLLTVVILSLIGFDFAAYWGKLRSHTLPMTGAPTATAADAWATACSVDPTQIPPKGIRFISPPSDLVP